MSDEPSEDDDTIHHRPKDGALGAGTLDQEEALRRIHALTADDDTILHGFAFFGEDEKHWYYVAILEREYQGNEYLNERYVQLVKPEYADERDDTWKKNGINRRVSDRLKEAATVLSYIYQIVAQREETHRAYIEGRLGEEIDPDEWDTVFVDVTEPVEVVDPDEAGEDV